MGLNSISKPILASIIFKISTEVFPNSPRSTFPRVNLEIPWKSLFVLIVYNKITYHLWDISRKCKVILSFFIS
jgi:hypothetical protein